MVYPSFAHRPEELRHYNDYRSSARSYEPPSYTKTIHDGYYRIRGSRSGAHAHASTTTTAAHTRVVEPTIDDGGTWDARHLRPGAGAGAGPDLTRTSSFSSSNRPSSSSKHGETVQGMFTSTPRGPEASSKSLHGAPPPAYSASRRTNHEREGYPPPAGYSSTSRPSSTNHQAHVGPPAGYTSARSTTTTNHQRDPAPAAYFNARSPHQHQAEDVIGHESPPPYDFASTSRWDIHSRSARSDGGASKSSSSSSIPAFSHSASQSHLRLSSPLRRGYGLKQRGVTGGPPLGLSFGDARDGRGKDSPHNNTSQQPDRREVEECPRHAQHVPPWRGLASAQDRIIPSPGTAPSSSEPRLGTSMDGKGMPIAEMMPEWARPGAAWDEWITGRGRKYKYQYDSVLHEPLSDFWTSTPWKPTKDTREVLCTNVKEDTSTCGEREVYTNVVEDTPSRSGATRSREHPRGTRDMRAGGERTPGKHHDHILASIYGATTAAEPLSDGASPSSPFAPPAEKQRVKIQPVAWFSPSPKNDEKDDSFAQTFPGNNNNTLASVNSAPATEAERARKKEREQLLVNDDAEGESVDFDDMLINDESLQSEETAKKKEDKKESSLSKNGKKKEKKRKDGDNFSSSLSSSGTGDEDLYRDGAFMPRPGKVEHKRTGSKTSKTRQPNKGLQKHVDRDRAASAAESSSSSSSSSSSESKNSGTDFDPLHTDLSRFELHSDPPSVPENNEDDESRSLQPKEEFMPGKFTLRHRESASGSAKMSSASKSMSMDFDDVHSISSSKRKGGPLKRVTLTGMSSLSLGDTCHTAEEEDDKSMSPMGSPRELSRIFLPQKKAKGQGRSSKKSTSTDKSLKNEDGTSPGSNIPQDVPGPPSSSRSISAGASPPSEGTNVVSPSSSTIYSRSSMMSGTSGHGADEHEAARRNNDDEVSPQRFRGVTVRPRAAEDGKEEQRNNENASYGPAPAHQRHQGRTPASSSTSPPPQYGLNGTSSVEPHAAHARSGDKDDDADADGQADGQARSNGDGQARYLVEEVTDAESPRDPPEGPPPPPLARTFSSASAGGFRISQGELKPIFLEPQAGDGEEGDERGGDEGEGSNRTAGGERTHQSSHQFPTDGSSSSPLTESQERSDALLMEPPPGSLSRGISSDFFNNLPIAFNFMEDSKEEEGHDEKTESLTSETRDFRRSGSGESDKTHLYFGNALDTNTGVVDLFGPSSPPDSPPPSIRDGSIEEGNPPRSVGDSGYSEASSLSDKEKRDHSRSHEYAVAYDDSYFRALFAGNDSFPSGALRASSISIDGDDQDNQDEKRRGSGSMTNNSSSKGGIHVPTSVGHMLSSISFDVEGGNVNNYVAEASNTGSEPSSGRKISPVLPHRAASPLFRFEDSLGRYLCPKSALPLLVSKQNSGAEHIDDDVVIAARPKSVRTGPFPDSEPVSGNGKNWSVQSTASQGSDNDGSIYLPGELDDPRDDFDYIGRWKRNDKPPSRCSIRTEFATKTKKMAELCCQRFALYQVSRENIDGTAVFLSKAADALCDVATSLTNVSEPGEAPETIEGLREKVGGLKAMVANVMGAVRAQEDEIRDKEIQLNEQEAEYIEDMGEEVSKFGVAPLQGSFKLNEQPQITMPETVWGSVVYKGIKGVMIDSNRIMDNTGAVHKSVLQFIQVAEDARGDI